MIRAIHWSPEPSCAPAFQQFRADEATVRVMTLTQVALYKQRTAFNALAETATRNEAEWARKRSEMEDAMKQMQIERAAADRIFQRELNEVRAALAAAESALQQLSSDHEALKVNSESEISNLQQRSAALQGLANDLEKKRAALQESLATASLNERLKEEAEKRVRELEDSIQRVRDKSRQMIAHLQRQRDESQQGLKRIQGELADSNAALQHESALRGMNESRALGMEITARKLAAALEIERLINEPLRNTNHESSTLTHVMRSEASPYVKDRSRTPLGHAASPNPSSAPYLRWGGLPAGSTSPGGELKHPSDGSTSPLGDTNHPLMQRSIVGRSLTRLGRSWATTTPTAGLPHPVFEDNYERHKHRYLAGTQGSSASHVRGVLSYPPWAKEPGGMPDSPQQAGGGREGRQRSSTEAPGLGSTEATQAPVTVAASLVPTFAGFPVATQSPGLTGHHRTMTSPTKPQESETSDWLLSQAGTSGRVSLSSASAGAAALATMSATEVTLPRQAGISGTPSGAVSTGSVGGHLHVSSILSPSKSPEGRGATSWMNTGSTGLTSLQYKQAPRNPSTTSRTTSSSHMTISYSPSREKSLSHQY